MTFIETYGRSSRGWDLQAYKIGSGKNLLVGVFAIHGYEDAWMRDGEEIFKLGVALAKKLGEDYNNGASYLKRWTIYIIPTANPDALNYGWTNNGPGRTTVGWGNINGIDLNRNFTNNYKSTSNRNNTGSGALCVNESSHLNDFITKKAQAFNRRKILLDVHGWMNFTQGHAGVGNYFGNAFKFNHASGYGAGFLIEKANSLGYWATLVELPEPVGQRDIEDKGYFAKLNTAIKGILENLAIDYLQVGANNNENDVRVLQMYLKAQYGARITVDGIYGSETEAYVRRLQKYTNITIDGIVGQETWTKIGMAAPGGVPDDASLMYTSLLDQARREGHIPIEVPAWGLWVQDFGKQCIQYTLMGAFAKEFNIVGAGIRAFIGVDVIDDIVDLERSIRNFDGSWGSIGEVGLNLVGVIPIVGMLKYGDETIALFKGGSKGTDIGNGYRAVKTTEELYDATKYIKNILDTNLDDLFLEVSETEVLLDEVVLRLRNPRNGVSEVKFCDSELTTTQKEVIKTHCFTGDTLVKTSEGLKRIDSVNVGELVLAKNIYTGEISYRPVLNLFKDTTKEFVNLNVNGKLIETTPGHLFRLANGEWRAAVELKVGDKILDSNEGYKVVEAVEEVVYDEGKAISDTSNLVFE